MTKTEDALKPYVCVSVPSSPEAHETPHLSKIPFNRIFRAIAKISTTRYLSLGTQRVCVCVPLPPRWEGRAPWAAAALSGRQRSSRPLDGAAALRHRRPPPEELPAPSPPPQRPPGGKQEPRKSGWFKLILHFLLVQPKSLTDLCAASGSEVTCQLTVASFPKLVQKGLRSDSTFWGFVSSL